MRSSAVDSPIGVPSSALPALPAMPEADSPSGLKCHIEELLQQLHHPVLVENENVLMDLTAVQWRLNVEFGKLIFSAWNSTMSLSRRVESVAYCDRNRFGIFVRRAGGRESTTLEFRELHSSAIVTRTAGRTGFLQQLTALLARDYRGWKFELVGNHSDREHSFSAWYTRGLATQGRKGWAFLGLGEEEGIAAADSILAFGLIWLDWLCGRSNRVVVTHLKLFVPPSAVGMIAHRAAYLNPRRVTVEIYEWSRRQLSPTPIDLKNYGNVETRLAPRRQAELLRNAHAELLRELLGNGNEGIEVVPDSAGTRSSLRIEGLEVGLIECQLAPRVYFGLQGRVRRLDESCHEDFRRFLQEVKRIRRAGTPEPQHEFYRFQSERWLESLISRDITRIDPALSAQHIYSQVPAFSGADRGVIDLLTTTRRGRLAVVELKVHEEINLPLQGLDYWLRVNWLHRSNQFREFGYFQGCELSPAPPLLYLVSPAFRFHSTTEKLLRYFAPEIEVILIGINDGWRKEIQVLFRHQGSGIR